ncbi:MAG: flagellar hook-associated protein FlgK [Pseudomonadota bacterium]
MSSVLINIGQSGAAAARAALELTSQNIANAGNADYTRRTLSQSEVVGTATIGLFTNTAFSGVRIGSINRSDSTFLQIGARDAASDLARADAELTNLRRTEGALESAGVFERITDFEAALGQLEGDPLDPSLRAAALESGRVAADSLQLASNALTDARQSVQVQAQAGVDAFNVEAIELAQINEAIFRALPGTAGYAALLDRRDATLSDMAEQSGIAVEYLPNGGVNVRMGDANGPVVVTGTAAYALSGAIAADGTISFDLNGTAVVPASGALSGYSSTLITQRDLQSDLDGIAAQLISTVNSAQTNGVDRNGAAGQPFFSGSTATDIGIALASGTGIATAPAGSPALSLDTGNIAALRSALGSNGPADGADALLFGLSSRISGQEVTRDALATISQSADSALGAETAVDLDQEAANLVRYQQAFQASSRIIQVANDIFDTMLGIR